MSSHASLITETTDASFEADVIQRSFDTLVVVDFWAAWCGPCRMLGPILEKLAREMQGQFVLVKADTEKVPRAAAEFGVSSIPAVFAVREGRVIDQFVGALPEPQIRAWIESLQPSEDEILAQEGEKLMAADPQAAEAKFQEALAKNVHNLRALKGLAMLYRDRGERDKARELLEEPAKAGALDAEAEKILAELRLGDAVGDDELQSLRERADADPNDGAAQLALAKACAAGGNYEEAMERALTAFQNDRAASGDAAREFLVQLFQLLGEDDPRTAEYRRRLTMLMY
ncbi:tetratricopeptide repeat protein [Thermostilla marina]